VAAPLLNVHTDRALWRAPYSDERSPAERYGVAAEEAFYRQPALLERELASLRPGTPGTVDVFFVGMAGYGGQDVFLREVEAVSRLFRERFDAEGRTIRLVNNRKSLLHLPIASRTSLDRSLGRVAEAMDRDEDVLVLFMTSHGSEDHRFALDLRPFGFHEVDPPTVRELLDRSGIRHRVVIVSSCYSGGFLKALESPDTLVITASAPDRNSFGCTNEAEWTYFGKAYFDEALRRTRSFAEAFELAAPAIAARERAQDYDPSRPQMSLGSAIAGRLSMLQRRLEDAR
ncbi:MAG TPA: C13 family peptidase, partial [Myxococcota bacterium]|nr:C13 family peptidase [Myxococcota bacterium]